MGKNVSSNGNGSFVAGGDITVSIQAASELLGNNIHDVLENLLVEVDKKVNDLFPLHIISARTKDKNREFDSKMMITSLGLIGIPIDVSLKVLELAVIEFESFSNNKDELSASEIRRTVAKSLMNVKTKYHSDKKIQLWTDKYIRRYGNPEQRIIIEFYNRKSEELDIEFLIKKLVPDLIDAILTQTKYEDFRRWVTKAEIRRMAREILDSISSLNIYSIQYDTLLQISKELALQPPHPWLVQKAGDYDAIKYNYTHTISHKDNLRTDKESEDISTVLYSSRECIHHSCAAILSYYGIFIGCGELAAINSLIKVLKLILNNDNNLIYHYARITLLKTDLENNSIQISHSLRVLDRIQRNVRINISENLSSISEYLDQVKLLIDMMVQLIEKHIFIHEIKKTNLEEINKNAFYNCTSKMARLLPCCKIIEEKKCHTWIEQNIGSPFTFLTKNVLIMFFYDETDDHTKRIRAAKRMLARSYYKSNAFLIISNKKCSESDKLSMQQLRNEEIYGSIFSLQETAEILTSINPAIQIKSLIHEQ